MSQYLSIQRRYLYVSAIYRRRQGGAGSEVLISNGGGGGNIRDEPVLKSKQETAE